MTRTALLRLLPLLAMVSTPVGAQGLTCPLVVPVDEGSRAAALRAWAELSLSLEKADARIRVSPLEALLEPASARLRAEALEKGLAAFRRGEALRKSEGLAAAKDAYVEATTQLLEADWRTGFEALVSAQAWKAAATGEQQDAALLFTVRPDFTFPAGALDPTLAAALEEQRAGKAKATKTRIEVRSAVPSLVWVDGQLIGVTPVQSPELLAGRHFITAIAPGYRVHQAAERLAPGAVLDLVLVDAGEGPAVRAGLAELAAAFRTGGKPPTALFEVLDVPELLAIGLTTTGPASAVRFDETGKSGAATRTPAAGQLMSSLLALARDAYDAPFAAATAAPVAVPVAAQPQPTAPALQPVAGRAMIITSKPPEAGNGGAIALVVMGSVELVAGGVFFGLGQAQAADAMQIPQVEVGRYTQAIDEARVKVGVGSIGGAVGLVGLGIGVALLATSGPTPPPKPAEPEKDEFSIRLVPGPGSVSVVGRF